MSSGKADKPFISCSFFFSTHRFADRSPALPYSVPVRGRFSCSSEPLHCAAAGVVVKTAPNHQVQVSLVAPFKEALKFLKPAISYFPCSTFNLRDFAVESLSSLPFTDFSSSLEPRPIAALADCRKADEAVWKQQMTCLSTTRICAAPQESG